MSKRDDGDFWVVVLAASLMAASLASTLLGLALNIQGWWKLLAVIPGIGCAVGAVVVLVRHSDV